MLSNIVKFKINYYLRDINVLVLYVLHTILIENTSYSGKTLF